MTLSGSMSHLKRRAVLGARRRRKAIRDRFDAWLFNRRILARALKRDHVICLGDSHVGILRHVRVPGVWFRVRVVGGATASGVLNPDTVTRAHTIFTERLRDAKPWQQVLLQLGEVDCGFVIWHRAQRHGLTVDEQLTYTLDSYTTFIETITKMGFRRVIVLSIPLPTIGDLRSGWEGWVASARKEVEATKVERTELTLRYNAEMQRRCNSLGATFVDVTTGHLDPDTGLVDERFLRATNLNHHLAKAPYRQLISDELRRLWMTPST
jgi:hypothetical protein